MKPKLRYLFAVLGLCLLSLAGCAFAGPAVEGSFDRTLTVSGPVDLDISTGSGSIRIRAGGSSAVLVHGLIRARDDFSRRGEEKVRFLEANPPVEQTGNTLRIGHIKDRNYSKNVSISYELEVPADTRVKGSTGSGNMSVEGIKGPLDASTGSGDVTASNIDGHVKADTGSGNVELHAINGGAAADTGSGNIRAGQVAGPFKADTGSGSIRLEQAAPGDVEVDTGSGNVEVYGVRGGLKADTGSGRITAGGEVTGKWKLSVGSGDVDIQLPSNAAFDLYAHTDSGNVKSDHPVTATGTLTPKLIRGKVRGGGPLLEVETGSGNIHIR
jgi:hypothetical protein